MSMDNALAQSETQAIPFASFFAKLKNALSIDIPTGYQDEHGFHIGVSPDEDSIRWPSNW